MELNQQIFKAPSIPKIGRRTVSSSVIRGASKSQIKLNKSVFSFVKPGQKSVDVNKITGSIEEGKKNFIIDKSLSVANNILVEIKKQLDFDYLSRIASERNELEKQRKRIAAQRVADKERSIEGGEKGKREGVIGKVVNRFKSIFQKLIDFFSIILTGILLNTAFKWLSDKNNQKKLAEFFGFLKEYWQELLIVFGIYKLIKLVNKLFKIAKGFKTLIDFLGLLGKGKGKLPCNCPPGSNKGPLDCNPIKDCVESLIKDPKRGPGFLNNLAQALLTTATFAPFLPLLNKQPTRPKPGPTGSPLGPITLPNPFGLPNWVNYTAYGLAGAGLIAGGIAAAPALGIGGGGGAAIGGGAATTNTVAGTAGVGLSARILSQLPKIMRPASKMAKSPIARANIRPNGNLVEKYIEAYKGSRPAELGGELRQLLQQIRQGNGTADSLSRVKAIRDIASKNRYENVLDQLKGLSLKSKGGTIDGFSGGGTVGGLFGITGMSGIIDKIGSSFAKGKDKILALLSEGEEVIRTRSAMLFRPLLKDINDNGGRRWAEFSAAVVKQTTNNVIQSELNKQFKNLIVNFKDLIDGEIKERRKKKPRGGGTIRSGGGGGWMGDSSMVNPFRNPKQWWNLGRNVRIPNERTAGLRTLIKDDLQQVGKFKTPTGYRGFNPMWSFTKGLGTGPTPIQRQLLERILPKLAARVMSAPVIGDMLEPRGAGAGSTLQEAIKRGDYKVPTSISTSSKRPRVTVINLPPKTVNLGPKPGSIKTPSSGSATEVPSISSVDMGNPYISYSRAAYGMIM